MRRIPGIRRVFRHERGTDVDVELQFHIDARTDDLVRLGLGRDEARRAALAEFGDLKRYETETLQIDRGYARITRIKEFLWSVWFDLGYSLRGLRRNPGSPRRRCSRSRSESAPTRPSGRSSMRSCGSPPDRPA
jgi:hypothetical protein